ncbi:MAG TPA: hypothetical protein VOA87_14720 [Thermoanaerobaculia bacterium]|nr:hypothetical protein [Thermoanaerobaculia bacterium]
MVPELRRAYNAAFSPEKYQSLVRNLDAAAGRHIEFRISETPIFLSPQLTESLVEAAHEVLRAVSSAEYLSQSRRAVPAGHSTPGEEGHPAFLQIDFALTRGAGADGAIVPQLIELQGFPSLYGFQWLLAREFRSCFDGAVPPSWTTYFGGLDDAGYAERLRELIVGDRDPDEVVLLEIEPEKQKTWVDFACTERLLGIRTVSTAAVVERGGRLFHRVDGRELPIRRIYNRVIQDEVERKGLALDHLFRRELDVEWVGHPNWFFRISKFSLPFIRSRYAPPAFFVSDLETYPDDLEHYVLKPLFSFAGLGVEMGVTPERLRAIENPQDFILQRKVDYVPLIETPEGGAKAEVRMMFIWRDRPLLVNNLVRMSKGAMMGVDFNKDKTWIGASVGFHPPQAP